MLTQVHRIKATIAKKKKDYDFIMATISNKISWESYLLKAVQHNFCKFRELNCYPIKQSAMITYLFASTMDHKFSFFLEGQNMTVVWDILNMAVVNFPTTAHIKLRHLVNNTWIETTTFIPKICWSHNYHWNTTALQIDNHDTKFLIN